MPRHVRFFMAGTFRKRFRITIEKLVSEQTIEATENEILDADRAPFAVHRAQENCQLTALPDALDAASKRHLRRIRVFVVLFIVGLFLSGVTAIPLVWELELLTWWLPLPAAGVNAANAGTAAGIIHWVHRVKDALVDVDARYPFLAYGTDWLAFGHFIIALVFVGAYRDPVRNIWLFKFGLIACALVIPYALIFGAIRGIPFGWRLIDCAFGIFGFPLLWLAKRETEKLARILALPSQ